MARTTDNEHSGHRERMRKKFIENGFDVFETHEALENVPLLCYSEKGHKSSCTSSA